MERPVFKPVGTPVEELDTPALVVDLDALNHNLETVHGGFADVAPTLRPDMSAHLCPAVASRQLASGGTVGGVAVSTVGEAKVFAQEGVSDILIANLLVTDAKIQAACGLAAMSDLTVLVERQDIIARFSEAATSRGVSLRLLIQVSTSDDQPGVDSSEKAATLATSVSAADGLRFGGLFARAGGGPNSGSSALTAIKAMRQAVAQAGIDVDTVCLAGTHDLVSDDDTDVVTEVVAGVYALMDHNHGSLHPDLKHAARLLTTVITHPEPDLAWLDTGQKAASVDTGLPAIDGVPGAMLTRMSAEHGGVALEGDARSEFEIGDKIWLIPADIANCANLYDYIYAAQDGKLAAVWEVAARGRYR